MKTLFITSFHPHISRNIFFTDVLATLKNSPNLRVVIVAPNYKFEYFQKHFAGANIVVEGVPIYEASKLKSGLFFKRLALLLMPSRTRWLKQRYKFYIDKKLSHFIFFIFANFLGRLPGLRPVFRYLDLKFSPEGIFYSLLDKYNPDAIFSTDIHNENDVALMQDARRRGIPILGMWRSWDNPTQSILRVFPEKFLVGSSALFEETVYWQKYPKERAVLTGHPHYDKYLKGPTKTKKEFFADFGLDLKKPLLLFTPLGDKFVRNNDIDQYAMEILGELANAQVLVRFPPDESVTLKNFVKPSNLVFHRPGFAFSKKFEDREIQKEDDESLINSIYYGDVLITGPTSIILDAAFFDKPVIAAHLIPPQTGGKSRHYFDTVYCFDFSHVASALATGGVKYVRSKEELIWAVNKYLSEPLLESNGRQKIREAWFSHADGKAGERVAGEVVKFLKNA